MASHRRMTRTEFIGHLRLLSEGVDWGLKADILRAWVGSLQCVECCPITFVANNLQPEHDWDSDCDRWDVDQFMEAADAIGLDEDDAVLIASAADNEPYGADEGNEKPALPIDVELRASLLAACGLRE